MSSVEWLCARCADKEEKQTETDPVLLRLCTSCKVENYVRPFGHAGEDALPSEEEIEEAKAFHTTKLKVLKKATANRKKKEAEAYKEAEKQVLEAETVEEEPEATVTVKVELDTSEAEEVIEAISEELDEKADEIAKLKAELAELEK